MIIKSLLERIKKFILTLKIKNILLLIAAGIVNAVGVNLFLAPVGLYDSGISGTSMLLSQVTPEKWTLSVFLILLNFPLFIIGMKKQGSYFTFYSLLAITVYSLASLLIINVLPIDVSSSSPLAGEDLLLCAIFGGIISGVGSGLTIRNGGAIDGIEVMAVMFSKKLNISVGTFVMIYNVILYVICGIVIQSWILPLYSIVTYAAGLKAVDFVVEGLDRSKSVMIITDKSKEINEALINEFKSGTTAISAKGGFSNADKTVVYFVVNRFQIYKMKNIIRSIDPKAFVTISDVADVLRSID